VTLAVSVSPKKKRRLFEKVLKHYRVNQKGGCYCLKKNEVNFSKLARDTGIKSHATLTRAFNQGKSLSEVVANKLEEHFNNLDNRYG
jgi:hypothetical protein